MSGNTNSVDNAGQLSGGLTHDRRHPQPVTNRVGGRINSATTITGDGPNAVDNSGTLNGLNITGDGTNAVANREGATITSSFTFAGDGRDVVFNAGTLTNGFTSTGLSIDFFANFGTIEGSDVALGGGDDRFEMIARQHAQHRRSR